MSAPPPAEAEVIVRAEEALAELGGGVEAQATAAWEWDPAGGARWWVEVVALRDGRVGVGASADAALGAAEGGQEGLAALPAAAIGRAHQGYDPAVLCLEAPGARAGVAKTAIVSTRGVRAYEQRSFVATGRDGLEIAAPSPAALKPSEGGIAVPGPEPADPPPGELPVVLGPAAVAAALDLLRPAFGRPGALAMGTRVAAACVSLSDSPRFAGTLPRSYDVHGVPRRPVPLIQDGVAHRLVSAATGHAVRPGFADAEPGHFVLVGGGAGSEEELMAPIALGAYLPTLDRAFLVEDGRIGPPLRGTIQVDPLAVLASTQALTSRQRTVPTAGGARTVGATVCPALRAGGGVALVP